MRKGYKTSNVIWCLGDDFAFRFANSSYPFMDSIIKIVNQNTDQIEFKYSTLEEYYNEMQSEL